MLKENCEYRVQDYKNRWSLIDQMEGYGLLENNTWGDETCYLVVKMDQEPAMKKYYGHDGSVIYLPTIQDVVCETYDGLEVALGDEGLLPEDWEESQRVEIRVDSELQADDGYLVGTVLVDGVSYPFDYNMEAESIDVHCYSEPSWLDGSCYEKPLPEVVTGNMEDVLGVVSDAVDEFLGEEVLLPECVKIPIDALELDEHILEDEEWLGDVIGDYLSDTYGYCHFGFQFHRGYDSETQELAEFFVTNIQWDIDKEQDQSIIAGSLDEKILEASGQTKGSIGEISEAYLGER